MSERWITKRVREDAAMICAIAASNPEFDGHFFLVATAIGIELFSEAEYLASLAWWKEWIPPGRECEHAANCESLLLLRSGWSPGDEP